MDIKSKRFDKLSLIRLICVILSAVFILTASVKTFGFISFLEENDGYEEFGDILEEYFTSSEAHSESLINREYILFIDTVLNRGLIYNSDTDKGYKEYLKKASDKYYEDFLKALIRNRNFGSDYFVLYSLDKGYINLNKIDDITYSSSSSFFYENEKGRRETYDETGLYLPYFEYDNDDSLSEDVTEAETTTLHDSNHVNDKTIYYKSGLFGYYDYCNEFLEYEDRYGEYPLAENTYGAIYNPYINYTDKNLIDKSKADAIVLIEDAYYGRNMTHYRGIYEVTLNKEKLDIFSKEGFVSSDNTSEITRDEYSKRCKDFDEALKQYKNGFFAVLDESTGRFTTNLTSGKNEVTAENAEKLIEKISPDFIKFSSGVTGYGQSQHSKQLISYIKSFCSSLSSENDFTLWVAFDSTLSGGADPFTHTDTSDSFVMEEIKNALPAVIIGLVGWLICLVVLIILTGRRSYDDELHMNRFDGIFTILRTAINLGLVVLAGFLIFEVLFSYAYYYDERMRYVRFITRGAVIISNILCVIASLLILDWILYIARHIKNRSLLKNISIVRFTLYLIKKSKQKKTEKLLRDSEYEDFKKKMLSVTVPVLMVLDVIMLFVLFFLSDYGGIGFLLLFPLIILVEIIFISLIMKYAASIRDILRSVHLMREGETGVKLDKSKMPPSLYAYADDINYVSEGLSNAVEKATREQRTKTELITNVSHDLKTPLTSIINYVDLLSKRPVDDEEAKKYITVLGEKSEKLKKLIEDLVEASKASAGNVPVNLIRMSLHELVSQVVGEHEDDLEAHGLTVIIDEKENSITVPADSKLSSRVLDNLMINVRKYALPGTRVYVRIFREGGFGCISISNISNQQLNIPVSELKERFVRGDESRSGDGSGLGLAIAEDFMTLQQGRLDLDINGDMFTATVRFRES